jgi:glycosyltransferase involved in cell wall biosynthesis
MNHTWPPAPPPVQERATLPPYVDGNPVKVLHVITRFWAGAGGNTLLSAVGMDKARYEVWIAGCPGGDLWERAAAGGVRTVPVKGFREVLTPADALVLWRLVRLIRRERFAVVHTHSAKGGFLGRLAARIARVPVVVHTFHGFAVNEGTRRSRRVLYTMLDRAARRWTHEFLAVAPRVAREAVETRIARPGAVRVVPSAVELEDIPRSHDRTALRLLGVPDDCPVVGSVGRVDHQKQPLDFVRVASVLARERPDTRFVLVGDGPLTEQVREEGRRLGVDVLVTGYRTDAPALAAGMDVFVITSAYEGLGRALTEALASGRPVVATAVNGVPDLVEHGSTGLLARRGDVAGLAEAIGWLLDHPREAAAMGCNGAARARAGFSAAAMCAAIDECYSELLGLEPPTGAVVALPEPKGLRRKGERGVRVGVAG